MAGRFSVSAVFRAVDKITAPVARMQRGVGRFTAKAERGFRRLNKRVGQFSKTIRKAGVVAAATFALTSGAMVHAASTGAQFEQAITNVGAVSLRTREQIKPLEEMALSLGRSTRFTATQAAEAMEVLARAGFKTNEILQATPAVLAAASASGLEIAEVANHVSNALKGMGLATSQAAQVADVLALASSKTNSSIGSLGESLKNVSSTARQLNIPLTEVVASVALLQDVGLDASVAGSAFNTMLTKMAAPTTIMQRKMRRFGIAFKDAKGDMLPLQDVLEQLNVATKKAGGNFDKVAFLAELVGLRGQKAASNLGMLFETGKLETLVKELENAEGSAQRMAELRMDTVLGSLDLLGSAVDAVKVNIFTLNEGPLKDIIDNMTAWVGANEELIASNIGNFLNDMFVNMDKILKTFKDIFIGIGAFMLLNAALQVIIGTFGILNFIMAANPIVLGIMAAVAAVAILSGALDPVLETLSAIGSGVSAAIDLATGLFGGQVVSPQERTAQAIEERRTTTTAEVTIKDETGRAEVTAGTLGPGLQLQNSGAF